MEIVEATFERRPVLISEVCFQRILLVSSVSEMKKQHCLTALWAHRSEKMNGISISGTLQLRSIGCAAGLNKSSSMIGGGGQWGGSRHTNSPDPPSMLSVDGTNLLQYLCRNHILVCAAYCFWDVFCSHDCMRTYHHSRITCVLSEIWEGLCGMSF